MSESAIILGAGASDGVGGALARRFANNGLHIIIAARTLEKIETLAKEIRDAGGSAEAVQVDVTSETDQDKLFALMMLGDDRSVHATFVMGVCQNLEGRAAWQGF